MNLLEMKSKLLSDVQTSKQPMAKASKNSKLGLNDPLANCGFTEEQVGYFQQRHLLNVFGKEASTVDTATYFLCNHLEKKHHAKNMCH